MPPRDVALVRCNSAIQGKPWGAEWRFPDDRRAGEPDPAEVKLIRINPGCALSVQHHEGKDETLLLLDGLAVIERRHAGMPDMVAEVAYLAPGEAVRILTGVVHRIVAHPVSGARFLEAATYRDGRGDVEDGVRHFGLGGPLADGEAEKIFQRAEMDREKWLWRRERPWA